MDTVNTPQLRLTALSVSDLVKLLKRSGSRTVSEDTVRKDVANDTPVNPDGTFNLINYAAYLAKDTDDASN
ncbi:MAG: hypothetical protein KAS17_02705 [Victivallaceae bacterium]|nr:hypothetical protein [Victivallaceae bacterium]